MEHGTQNPDIRTNLQLNPVSIYTKFWTVSSFTNAKEVYEIYSKSKCLLNDIYIEDVTFSFSAGRNILGLDFFQRFSSVYIDSDNCRIYCCK